MGGLQSSVGLISGIPIQDTIDQLISISGIPRDNLEVRNAKLRQRQAALSEVLASVIAVQISSETLSKADLFSNFKVTPSNPTAVSTNTTGTPTPGSFQFQPHRLAQTHQLLSSGFDSDTTPIGEGSLTFNQGGFIDRGLKLTELNGGAGIQRGLVRITDRSGATADIDLRFASTVEDVLSAVNQSSDINVTLQVDGDSFQLVDNTGQTTSNLIVQNVGSSTTATDLGLGAVNVAASSATGLDVVYLSESTKLSRLNGGDGVQFDSELADLQITFRDNSTALEIDFDSETTIGDVLATLNAADPARLSAQISADGDRIELTDLTTDSGGTFSVSSLFSGNAAESLGLDTTASGATIQGSRLQAGLKTTLLNQLSGGNGLGELGIVDVTDRSGSSASIDLSSAETIDEVIELFNSSGLGITASYNESRSGIQISDTTGSLGNLIIANNADGLLTADKLKLATNDAVSTANSGSLGVKVISRGTRLETLNNGDGVDSSSFIIRDSNGNIGAVNLAVEELETIGEVIDAINDLTIGVEARINADGDGILLFDTAGGSETLTVEESGNGSAAADLGILGTATTLTVDGSPVEGISGSFSTQIEIEAEDTLDDLIEKINSANAGLSASKFFDGEQYRLSIYSQESGRDGQIRVDSTDASFSLSTITEGKDAVIVIGDPNSLGAGILATSSSNTFSQVIPGVEFTLNEVTNAPITIQVDENSDKVKSNLKLFVDAYNKVIDKLDEHTKFTSTESDDDVKITTGPLFGTSEVLRVRQALGELVSGRFFGAGSITSLAEVGIDVSDKGKISFDEEKFNSKYASDPDALVEFFSDEESGIFKRFNDTIDALSGEENSVLVNGSLTLQRKIDGNQDRIDRLTDLLDLERTRLEKQFFALENSLQSIQSSQSSISTLLQLANFSAQTQSQA